MITSLVDNQQVANVNHDKYREWLKWFIPVIRNTKFSQFRTALKTPDLILSKGVLYTGVENIGFRIIDGLCESIGNSLYQGMLMNKNDGLISATNNAVYAIYKATVEKFPEELIRHDWPKWAVDAEKVLRKDGQPQWWIPKTHYDQGKLGLDQNHCVGNREYRSNVADGSKVIIVYTGDNISKPCTITVGFNNPFDVGYSLGKYNKEAPHGRGKLRSYLDKWIRKTLRENPKPDGIQDVTHKHNLFMLMEKVEQPEKKKYEYKEN